MTRPTRSRSCEGKQQHGSRAAARTHIHALIAKGAGLLNVYKCRYCKTWHVGHLMRRHRR
jgi:hypothetical protein